MVTICRGQTSGLFLRRCAARAWEARRRWLLAPASLQVLDQLRHGGLPKRAPWHGTGGSTGLACGARARLIAPPPGSSDLDPGLLEGILQFGPRRAVARLIAPLLAQCAERILRSLLVMQPAWELRHLLVLILRCPVVTLASVAAASAAALPSAARVAARSQLCLPILPSAARRRGRGSRNHGHPPPFAPIAPIAPSAAASPCRSRSLGGRLRAPGRQGVAEGRRGGSHGELRILLLRGFRLVDVEQGPS